MCKLHHGNSLNYVGRAWQNIWRDIIVVGL